MNGNKSISTSGGWSAEEYKTFVRKHWSDITINICTVQDMKKLFESDALDAYTNNIMRCDYRREATFGPISTHHESAAHSNVSHIFS